MLIHAINTKKPVNKTEDEIVKYLKSNKISFYDYTFLLSENIDTLANINHVLDLWKYERQREQSTMQIRVYNSLGNLVNGYTQCYGDFNILNIFSEKETRLIKHLPNNYSLRFENELQLLNIDKDLENEILLKNSQKKYTFVVYWNIWSNYFSKIMFKKIKNYLKEYENKENILIILINTDNMYRNENTL